MNLYLMRHGVAVEPGTPGYGERERPLTPEGERKVQRIAEAILRMDLSFDAILSSPLARARRTAEIILHELKANQKLQLTEHLSPGVQVKGLVAHLNTLRGSPREVLLVGHEPDLGRLVSVLLTGDDGLRVVFKKGGLCKLAIENLQARRCATLEWLLTPRQLELMATRPSKNYGD